MVQLVLKHIAAQPFARVFIARLAPWLVCSKGVDSELAEGSYKRIILAEEEEGGKFANSCRTTHNNTGLFTGFCAG